MGLIGVVVVITFLLNILQIMYGSKSVSLFDTHPNIMLIAISTFLLYCFACYLKHNLTSFFRSSTWPALLIYTNFMTFLGFVSIVSLASIVFSTSSTSLAILYMLSSIFFTGKSVLDMIQNRNSLFAVKGRSNNYVNDMQAEVKLPFGRLNEILDVELGLGSHYAALNILPNFWMGKVKDGPKTRSSKKVSMVWRTRRVSQLENLLKRKHKECMSVRAIKARAKLGGEVNAKKRRGLSDQKGIVIKGVENSGIVAKLGFFQDNQMSSTKGKSKIMSDNLCNNNGLWSQEAIAALEKGKPMNKKLCKMVLNLEDKVTQNVTLAEWLEKETQAERGFIPHAE